MYNPIPYENLSQFLYNKIKTEKTHTEDKHRSFFIYRIRGKWQKCVVRMKSGKVPKYEIQFNSKNIFGTYSAQFLLIS